MKLGILVLGILFNGLVIVEANTIKARVISKCLLFAQASMGTSWKVSAWNGGGNERQELQGEPVLVGKRRGSAPAAVPSLVEKSRGKFRVLTLLRGSPSCHTLCRTSSSWNLSQLRLKCEKIAVLSKCDSWSSSSTWEPVRSADSHSPPGPIESETLGTRPSNPCFTKPSRSFWCTLKVETTARFLSPSMPRGRQTGPSAV